MEKSSSPFDFNKFIGPAVLVLIALASVFFYFWPQTQQIPVYKEKIKGLEVEVNELSVKYNTLQSLNISELKDLGNKADAALPTEKSFAGLLTGLELLAGEGGSKLLTFESSPGLISTKKPKTASASASQPELPLTEGATVLPTGLKYLTAAVGISSNPASLVDLTAKLAKASRLVTLENVNFTSSQTGAEAVNTSVNLWVYFQPEATVSGVIDFAPISQEEHDLISKVDAYNRFILELPNQLPIKPNPFE